MNFIKENIGIILFIVFMLVLVWLFIRACKYDRKEKRKLLQEMEQPYVEPQVFEYRALVVEKYVYRKNLGNVRFPQTVECCCAVFKTQDGKLWEGDVSLEEFSQLQENQSVTIAVADNKFYGFYINE